MGGATCTLFPMPVRGRSFLRLIVFAAGHLPAVSFLIVHPAFLLRKGLVIIVGSWWPLPNYMPQLFVLSSRFPGEVLDAGYNNLHLPFDRGHGKIGAGSLVVDSFHSCD